MNLNAIVMVMLTILSSFTQAHQKQSGFFTFQKNTHLSVKLQFSDYATEMQKLNSLHLDIAGVDVVNKTAEVLVTETEFKLLRHLGFDATVTMTNFVMAAPDQNYKTSNEIEAILRDYNLRYPQITKLVEVGKTLLGKSIWAVKISTNPEISDNTKPDILFNAMHHAREVMGPEVALDIIQQLVENYGSDSQITKWVSENEIWVLPMFNVDGNGIVWTNNNMWRKNARGDYGVDINRNYPYAWGSCNGSSESKSAQDYRGEGPASEPETQVMMNFIKQIRPVFNISYHSFSELVIYPMGCNGKRSPIADVIEPLGQAMGQALKYTAGTAWETLYSVDGGDIDWMHNEYNVIPYVIEVNSQSQGFQPPYSVRQATVERNRSGWQMLLNRLTGSGVRGVVMSDNKLVSNFQIVVQKRNGFMFSDYTTYKGNADGSYHLILNEGSYRLKFISAENRSADVDILVGTARIEQNINL